MSLCFSALHGLWKYTTLLFIRFNTPFVTVLLGWRFSKKSGYSFHFYMMDFIASVLFSPPSLPLWNAPQQEPYAAHSGVQQVLLWSAFPYGLQQAPGHSFIQAFKVWYGTSYQALAMRLMQWRTLIVSSRILQ